MNVILRVICFSVVTVPARAVGGPGVGGGGGRNIAPGLKAIIIRNTCEELPAVRDNGEKMVDDMYSYSSIPDMPYNQCSLRSERRGR